MFWWIFLGVFLLLVIYLLYVPVILYVNTLSKEYFVRVKGLAKVSLEGDDEEFIRIKLTALFTKFYFYPLRKDKKAKEKKKKTVETKPRKLDRQKGMWYLQKGITLLKTFEVKQFSLQIDTGDYVQNAKLIPVFSLLDYYLGDFKINFQDKNSLVFHLENKPIRILKVFINPKKLHHGITL